MGEKGNVADVRGTGGHVASATQAAPSTGVGLGGQQLSGSAPQAGGGGGGGLLSDLADKAGDKITDVGLGGGTAGIVKHDKDDQADTE